MILNTLLEEKITFDNIKILHFIQILKFQYKLQIILAFTKKLYAYFKYYEWDKLCQRFDQKLMGKLQKIPA
jgi:hypothetical protein